MNNSRMITGLPVFLCLAFGLTSNAHSVEGRDEQAGQGVDAAEDDMGDGPPCDCCTEFNAVELGPGSCGSDVCNAEEQAYDREHRQLLGLPSEECVQALKGYPTRAAGWLAAVKAQKPTTYILRYWDDSWFVGTQGLTFDECQEARKNFHLHGGALERHLKNENKEQHRPWCERERLKFKEPQ